MRFGGKFGHLLLRFDFAVALFGIFINFSIFFGRVALIRYIVSWFELLELKSRKLMELQKWLILNGTLKIDFVTLSLSKTLFFI